MAGAGKPRVAPVANDPALARMSRRLITAAFSPMQKNTPVSGLWGRQHTITRLELLQQPGEAYVSYVSMWVW